MSKKYVGHVPLRISLIVILTLGGFVFPLLFFVAAFIAWALISEVRDPAKADENPEHFRRFATPDDPDWRSYWLAQCESPAETAFFEAIVAAYGLLPSKGMLRQGDVTLELQVKITPYRVDFLFNGRLVVEVDGAAYHSSPEAVASDAARDESMRGRGYTILRIPAKVVFASPDEAVRRVQIALANLPAEAVAPPVSVVQRAKRAANSFSDGLDRFNKLAAEYEPPVPPPQIEDLEFHKILLSRIRTRAENYAKHYSGLGGIVWVNLQTLHHDRVRREEEAVLREEWNRRSSGSGPASEASLAAAIARCEADVVTFARRSPNDWPDDEVPF